MANPLEVKDASGSIKKLEMIDGSAGVLIPVHSLTGSINVASASLDYLTSSMSSSSDRLITELGKLTAHSTSNGLKVTGSLSVDVVMGDTIGISSSTESPVYVSLVNNTNLTASVSVSNLPAVQPVSFNSSSLTASVSVSNLPAVQPVSFNSSSLTASVIPSIKYATSVTSGSSSDGAGQGWTWDETCRSLAICNRTDKLAYIKLAPSGSTPTAGVDDYSYVLETGETYEAIEMNAKLPHAFTGSLGAVGKIVYTKTY